MRIVDAQKKYKDGRYYVDYGIAGLVMYNFCLWRFIASNYSIERVVDKVPLLPDVERLSIAVDWDLARKAANEQGWAWLPKMYGWIDSARSGEAVIAELVSIGKQVDQFKRAFQSQADAARRASMKSMADSVAVGDIQIARLEYVKAVSKFSLGAGATVASGGAFAGAVLGKAALSGVEMRQAGVSIRSVALNVGCDLALDFGKAAKKVGDGFSIVAKGLTKGAGAYMSGKSLSDATIEGLVESSFQAAGAGAGAVSAGSRKQIASMLSKSKANWMIPLGIKGSLPNGAAGVLKSFDGDKADKYAKAAIKDGGKLLRDVVKIDVKAGQNASPVNVDVSPANVSVADAGAYEKMIKESIYPI